MRKSPLMKFIFNFSRLLFVCTIVLVSNNLFSQTAPVITPKGGFKIDGHLRANTPAGAASVAGDWVPRVNGTAFTAGIDSFVLSSAGVPEDNVTTRLQRDEYNNNIDDIFTQGSKFNDYISALHWGLGGAPNKNDIHNGVFHASGDNANPSNQWVFIGGDRLDVAGTSYIDFQFLQGTITTNASTFTGSGLHGGRSIGDINISMEYNNGGSAPKVVIYRWAPTNDAGTAWAWDSTGSSEITEAYAKTNLVNAEVPFGAFGNTTYQPYAFVEAAINVTQLVSLSSGNCAGLSIKTLWITTKASSASTAALKDFMTPISLDLTFGGVSITAVNPVCEGSSNITLVGNPSGGTFSGNGVSGTTFSPTTAGVGTHTIVYQASAGVNCTKTTSIEIVVNPNPTVTVNSPVKCTDAPAVTITATPGSGAASDYDYAWTVPEGVTPPGNVQSFTSSTGGAYSCIITRKTTNCSSPSGGGTLTVNPNPGQPAVTVTPPTCGNSNGNVTVTSPVDGGGFDYEYSNNGGTYQESTSFTVASGAAYSIVARNKTTQCTSVARTGTMGSASATPPATVIITQNVDCSHLTGKVKIVQASAGNPEYDNTIYEFSNGGAFGSDPEFTFTAGGGYGLTVRKKADITCTQTVSCAAESARTATNTGTLTESSARVLGEATLEISSSVMVRAMPNPFSDKVRFMITTAEAGNGTLDIYNVAGQKIKTVFQGYIPAGVSYFDLKLATQQRGNLVYTLTIGGQKISGKLLQLSNK
jgi:hypothetical protein